MRRTQSVVRVVVTAVAVLSPLVVHAGDGRIHRVGEKVPNSYIVMLYTSQPADSIGQELEQRHGGKLRAVMKHLSMFSLQLPNEAAAEAIARDPRVAEVEEDAVIRVTACGRALKSDGSQWALAHLNDPNYISFFNATVGLSIDRVRVYIIDTSIDISTCDPANDLRNSLFGNTKIVDTQHFETACSADPGEGKGPHLVSAIRSHGAAVASVLAGNTYGVVPEVTSIVSLIAADCQGNASSSSLLQSGNYAVQTHTPGQPAVANVSLAASGGSDALDSMLKQMVDNGIFVAGAAGNSGLDACVTSPGRLGGTARYPGLMVTGASDYYGYPTYYSNSGACVDIWAPGGDAGTSVATSVGTGYGTSLSAPAVAGAAVLIYSQHPTWTPADVWSQIKYLDLITYRGVRTLHIPEPCCYVCDNLGCYWSCKY